MSEETTASEPLNPPSIDVEQERKKARLVAMLFCDYAITSDDGKPSLMGVFERILVSEDEKKIPSIGFFLRLANAVTGQVQIAIYAPSGVTAGGFAANLDVLPPSNKPVTHTHMLGRLGFETPEEGTYWIAAFHNGALLGGARLIVDWKPKEGATNEHTSGDSE